ncbi:hypothetical protein [Bacillus wiedmannii]|uniref:hypothetical protein n=1 Tax=Bacillus wiedmannii TaxID=1890302 RepID=UPI0012470BA7|nr:hypothetical protein [Bacillus wiedmannii]
MLNDILDSLGQKFKELYINNIGLYSSLYDNTYKELIGTVELEGINNFDWILGDWQTLLQAYGPLSVSGFTQSNQAWSLNSLIVIGINNGDPNNLKQFNFLTCINPSDDLIKYISNAASINVIKPPAEPVLLFKPWIFYFPKNHDKFFKYLRCTYRARGKLKSL